MNHFTETAKTKYRKKEKLAKLRRLVMIVLMVIAGLYYVIIEQKGNVGSRVVTNPLESVKETKYSVESFLEPTLGSETTEADTLTIDTALRQNGTATQDAGNGAALELLEEEKTPPAQKSTEAPSSQEADAMGSARINLNTATLEELDALPGVGPSTAQNIITYRETYGGFAAPEEIMNVKRIGEKTYEKLKDYITVA